MILRAPAGAGAGGDPGPTWAISKIALLWSSQIDPASHGQRAVGYALENGDFHSALINQEL